MKLGHKTIPDSLMTMKMITGPYDVIMTFYEKIVNRVISWKIGVLDIKLSKLCILKMIMMILERNNVIIMIHEKS